MDIIIYTKTSCPWCIDVLDFLNERGISYEEKNVSQDQEFFKELKEISGQTKAPTFIINGTLYPDSDVDELRQILGE